MTIRPQIVAHRGHGSEPENTLRAFRAGHAAGADRVELDVHRSADGDFVVIHDPKVDRTTDGKGLVARMTTAALRKLDAGKGEKLPLLSEAISWAESEDVALVIEAKHLHEGDEVDLARMIRGSKLRDPWVISYDAAFMERFEKQAPEVKTGALVHERPLLDRSLLGAGIGIAAGVGVALAAGLAALPFAGVVAAGKLLGALTGFGLIRRKLRTRDLERDVDMHIPGKRIINQKLIDRAHRLGKDVGVYTVDSVKKGRKLVDMGVDALITNYPERHRP